MYSCLPKPVVFLRDLFQGCPDPNTPPPLVEPSARLLDLERFAADLRKYRPFMSPQAWHSWQEFVENSSGLCQPPSDAFWEMPDLVLVSKCVPHAKEDVVSNETTTLVEKETRAPTGVCLHKEIYMCNR